jgi:hypothetical protein
MDADISTSAIAAGSRVRRDDSAESAEKSDKLDTGSIPPFLWTAARASEMTDQYSGDLIKERNEILTKVQAAIKEAASRGCREISVISDHEIRIIELLRKVLVKAGYEFNAYPNPALFGTGRRLCISWP